MREKLEVVVERRDGKDCGRVISDAFWVSGPERDDLWRAEPDPYSGYSMSNQAVFYKESSNDCFLLKRRETWCPKSPEVIGAIRNTDEANKILYAEALKYADKILSHHEVPFVDKTQMREKK